MKRFRRIIKKAKSKNTRKYKTKDKEEEIEVNGEEDIEQDGKEEIEEKNTSFIDNNLDLNYKSKIINENSFKKKEIIKKKQYFSIEEKSFNSNINKKNTDTYNNYIDLIKNKKTIYNSEDEEEENEYKDINKIKDKDKYFSNNFHNDYNHNNRNRENKIKLKIPKIKNFEFFTQKEKERLNNNIFNKYYKNETFNFNSNNSNNEIDSHNNNNYNYNKNNKNNKNNEKHKIQQKNLSEKINLLTKYSLKLNTEWIPLFDENGVIYFHNRISNDLSFNFPKIFNKKSNKYENLLYGNLKI
jgi:hypothetical protein